MTELIIDGVQAVLQKGFSVTVKRENPVMTKNGEYTYDMTLQLDNPINAELYKHLNRLNAVEEVTTKRSLVLIADNRVYCRGTEIITAWTEESVTIQAVSGNSELNYFIGGDLLLEHVEMGEAVVDSRNMRQYIEKKYPEVEFCLCPVAMPNESLINDWRIQIVAVYPSGQTSGKKVPLVDGIRTPSYSSIYVQPYLCSYIEKIVQGLGYTITQNELAASEWNTLILIQSGHPTQYAMMLPGWTVTDFFAEIEKLFNLIIITDNKSKEARILFKNSFYIGENQVSVKNVIDAFECEVEELEGDVSSSNIIINSPDSDYYRIHHLNRTTIDAASKVDLENELAVREYIEEQSFDNVKNTIFFTTDKQRYYVAKKGATSAQTPYIEVNAFGDLVRADAESEVELNMMPSDYSEYALKSTSDAMMENPNMTKRDSFTTDKDLSKIELPFIESDIYTTEEEDISIYEQIAAETSATSQNKSSDLRITFYQGLRDVMVWPVVCYNGNNSLASGPFDPQSVKYPFPFNMKESGGFHGNMRTTYLNRMLYESTYQIDVNKAVKVTSYDPNLYDTRQIFEIRNKRYVCKDMEFVLDVNGRKKGWSGVFYPIKISDTESFQRWVLTDGKWRDGGLWLDNGRWLDE